MLLPAVAVSVVEPPVAGVVLEFPIDTTLVTRLAELTGLGVTVLSTEVAPPEILASSVVKSEVAAAMLDEQTGITKSTGGKTSGQSMSSFKASRWSGNDHLWWTGGKVGDTLTLALPVSAKGAYEIKAASGEARATLFGTGTELALALKAAETLEAEGVPTRVVSVPCFELFEQQDAAYQASVIGRGTVRVAVEAAIKQGWERFIGEDGAFIGMTGFGASAPAEVLYEKFGITSDAIVAAVKARL